MTNHYLITQNRILKKALELACLEYEARIDSLVNSDQRCFNKFEPTKEDSIGIANEMAKIFVDRAKDMDK